MSYQAPNSQLSSLLVFWLPAVLLASATGYFFSYLNTHALNIPHHDDIIDFVQFINRISEADSLKAALDELFQHYNHHRTTASRLVVYLAFLVQGEINFHTLALLANASLPLILVLFFICAQGNPYRWLFLVPCAFLLLNIRTTNIPIWGQVTFAYCMVFFYAFASIIAIHSVTPMRFCLAALFCILASLTFAAAQMVWVFGFASLVHQCWILKSRPWSYLFIWVALAAAVLVLWHMGIEPIGTSEVAKPSSGMQAILFPGLLVDATYAEKAERFVSFFLVMLGSTFAHSSTFYAAIAGGVMLTLLLISSFVHLKEADQRLLLCCWYVVATCVAITYGRALVAAPDYVLTSRYSFLGTMFAATLLMLLQTRMKLLHSYLAYALSIPAIIYCIWVYQAYEAPMQAKITKRTRAFNEGHYHLFLHRPEETNAIVHRAIDSGRYHPPCRPLPDCENQ